MSNLSCYDCVHCNVCSGIYSLSFHVSDVSKCKFFENKESFKEVVHCKECIYYNKKHGACECSEKGIDGLLFTEDDDFCSYGEKGE